MENTQRIKVSFDFDGVLTESDALYLAFLLSSGGIEVYITTNRPNIIPALNADVFAVARQIGAKDVRFTNYDEKSKWLDGFLWHIDDDRVETELIETSNTSCHGIHYSLRKGCLAHALALLDVRIADEK